jgi:hypothetical protein
MTERKPTGMSFASWIDQQIAEATERGAFDNLPGAGEPIPHHGDEDASQAWLREYLRKEGMSADALLPTPLRLRLQIERLAKAVPAMSSEQEVREAVSELNHQVMEWRRIPLGPPIFVPKVDEDAMVSQWRAARPPVSRGARPGEQPAGRAAGRDDAADHEPAGLRSGTGPGRKRWRRRRAGG